jgi:hypothetical protein
MTLPDRLSAVKAVGYTVNNIENHQDTVDNPTVLVGGHDTTVVDTGHLLGEEDGAPNSAAIDIDLDSSPRENPEDGIARVALLEEDAFDFLPAPVGGQPLLDADILSGSYDTHYAIVAELGPDGIGQVLFVGAPLSGDDPLTITLLGEPIGDFLI